MVFKKPEWFKKKNKKPEFKNGNHKTPRRKSRQNTFRHKS